MNFTDEVKGSNAYKTSLRTIQKRS